MNEYEDKKRKELLSMTRRVTQMASSLWTRETTKEFLEV